MSKIGQDLIEAMQELQDFSEGKIELKRSFLHVTPVCEYISATDIKKVRNNLNLTQNMFAMVIGVSKKTVESWEAGRYKPDGAARRLISIMQLDPEFMEKYDILKREQVLV